MRYQLKHTTEYRYQQPTSLSYNEVWMTPRELPYQKVLRSEILLQPEAAVFQRRKDIFENSVAFFAVQQAHELFTITAISEIDRTVPQFSTLKNYPQTSWENSLESLNRIEDHWLDAKSFTLPSPLVMPSSDLEVFAKPSFSTGRPLFEAVHELSTRIYKYFEYIPNFTTIATPLQKVVQARKGVCQDFAHVAIGCLRALGLPARYVSGYIETIPPEGESALVGAVASHAWFSTYIPELGWVDFDPTNNQITKDQHITVAWGRDYSDVPPLKGVIFNGNPHELHVDVEMTRLLENQN